MRIACLPIGNLENASTWFRIAQYLPFFEKEGIHLEFISKHDIDPESLKSYDLIINQKNLFSPWKWQKIIKQKKVVFDFDDALWTRPIKPYNWITQLKVNHRLKFWIKSSAHTFVANGYLADYAKQMGDEVSILPMSLDLDIWKPGMKEEGLIGWSGTPHNFPHLERIQDELLLLKNEFPHLRFAIYSGTCPKLKFPFEYVPFKKGEEHLFTQRLSMGLLPLDDTAYSRGKSPIKSLQYLACKVPIVTNATGASLELLQGNAEWVNTSWYETIALLLNDKQKQERFSQRGREIAENHHDIKKVSSAFIKQLQRLIS